MDVVDRRDELDAQTIARKRVGEHEVRHQVLAARLLDATEAHPDPTQFDPKSDYFDAASKRDEPRWSLVDVKFKRKLKRTITLTELKGRKELGDFALTRQGNRLSVLPVSKAQWDFILSLEQ